LPGKVNPDRSAADAAKVGFAAPGARRDRHFTLRRLADKGAATLHMTAESTTDGMVISQGSTATSLGWDRIGGARSNKEAIELFDDSGATMALIPGAAFANDAARTEFLEEVNTRANGPMR
jgi:hypothetical protein